MGVSVAYLSGYGSVLLTLGNEARRHLQETACQGFEEALAQLAKAGFGDSAVGA